jgi:hypothetical protein
MIASQALLSLRKHSSPISNTRTRKMLECYPQHVMTPGFDPAAAATLPHSRKGNGGRISWTLRICLSTRDIQRALVTPDNRGADRHCGGRSQVMAGSR